MTINWKVPDRVTIRSAVFHDRRLSLAARGLLGFFLSSDFPIDVDHLYFHLGKPEDDAPRIALLVQELRDAGYLVEDGDDDWIATDEVRS